MRGRIDHRNAAVVDLRREIFARRKDVFRIERYGKRIVLRRARAVFGKNEKIVLCRDERKSVFETRERDDRFVDVLQRCYASLRRNRVHRAAHCIIQRTLRISHAADAVGSTDQTLRRFRSVFETIDPVDLRNVVEYPSQIKGLLFGYDY